MTNDTLPCGHPAACVVGDREGTNYCGWCEDITRPESLSADKVQATAQYQSLRIEASRLRKELAAARAELESVQAQAAAMRKALVSALHEVRLHSEEYHHVTDALTKGFIEASIEGAAGRELQEELERLRARVAELEAGDDHAYRTPHLEPAGEIVGRYVPGIAPCQDSRVLVPRADWDARPQWRDRPTCDGRWVLKRGVVSWNIAHLVHFERWPAMVGERYFGPIPEDAT